MVKEVPPARAARPRRQSPSASSPTHPVWKANLLMIGVVLLLLAISVASVGAGQ